MKSSTKCRLITIFVHKSYPKKRQSYLFSIHLARPTKRVPDLRGHCKSRTMRAVPLFFAILSTATGFKIETKKPTLVKLTKGYECDPTWTKCPAGCCPFGGPSWFCCQDDQSCAPTPSDCAFEAKRSKLIKLAKINQCGPDETDCPNGCCPHTNWYCCPDSFNCAATAADCAFEVKNNLLVELAKSDQCGPDETLCPTGCCPGGPHWVCCHDDFWPGCAPTAADCS